MASPAADPSRSRGGYFSSIKPLVVLVWRASPTFFVSLFLLTVLTGLQPVASIYLNSRMLDVLVVALNHTISTEQSTRELIELVVLLGAVGGLGFMLTQLSQSVQTLFQMKVANYAQNILIEKAAGLDLAYFENPTFHNQLQNASQEAGHRPLAIVQQLMQVISIVATLVSLGVVLLLWKWWIVPVALVSSLALFLVMSRFTSQGVVLALGRTGVGRKANYFKSLLINDRAAKEIRLLNLQDYLLRNIRQIWAQIYHEEKQFVKKKLRWLGIAGTGLSLGQPLLVGYVAWQVLAQSLSLGKFSFYAQSLAALHGGLNRLMTTLSSLHESDLFASSLLNFLKLEPQVEAARKNSPALIAAAHPHLIFEQVSFSYPDTGTEVLKKVSFEIRPGENIALIGDNGAGKTTLVKLLAGLYEPTSGRILLDGVDIATVDRKVLRNKFSMLLQDFQVYHFSLRENIALGRIDHPLSTEELYQVSASTGLDEIARKLPAQYDTILGRFFERGHELSGGQRQLVALSRALIRRSPILVLDEPTSALDTNHEKSFYDLLFKTLRHQQQSTLFICHRLASLNHADRIVVLHEGTIIESGTHEQLIQLGQYYARRYRLQMSLHGAPAAPSDRPTV